ncbi:MAG: hypothetical protein A2583_12310 [Bdellovibrionales bacterium RIFOXYD1_FULL_53_11]|nr:MAG: hypothetical protein A2583_12310 [Bdellovibrionales bacterium RIFOXYD1_FULL_53_11]
MRCQYHRTGLAIGIVAAMVAVGPGCFNNAAELTRKLITTGGTESDMSTGTASYITLTRVVKSSADPNRFMDLIGDSSGAIGTYCFAASGSSDDPTAETNCYCSFEYTTTAGLTETKNEKSVYREADLLRCSYSTIPTAITSLKVQLYISGDEAYSNAVTFSFSGTGLSNTDHSDPDSFIKVLRHQCKDSVFVSHILDPAVYDPFLSEDSELSFPLNFYVSNLGAMVSAFVNNNKPADGASWICPTKPKDTTDGVTDYVSAGEGYDLRLFSVGSVGGSKTIYPVTGADRHTFYLAQTSSAPFNVAVNAFVAPSVPTSENTAGGAPAPVGFGAMAVPTGDDSETCPDTSVVIPSGYKWAKLWLFRGSIPARKAPTSQAVKELGYVGCNPGVWPSTGFGVVASCAAGSNTLASLSAAFGGTGAAVFADRVIYSRGARECIRIKDATAGQAAATYAVMASGTDFWETGSTIGAPINGNLQILCGGANNQDPMGLCDANYASGTGRTPHSSGTLYEDIDTSSRWDAVFTVSPVTVMTSDMRNRTAAGKPYIPYRFTSPSYCSSADPDNPDTAGDCDPRYKIDYNIDLRDLTVAEGATLDDTSKARKFPICVLQPL